MLFARSWIANVVAWRGTLYVAAAWFGQEALHGLWEPDAYYPALMYDTGLWCVLWLVATLSVTPFLMLINWLGHARAFGRWILPRRRHFGLISAGFAGLHLWYYLVEERSVAAILFDLQRLEFAVGWISLVSFVILAMTSNAWSVRYLGRAWKRLHVLVYLAAACAMWHWYLLDWYVARSLFWSVVMLAPLAVRPALHYIRRALPLRSKAQT